MRWRRRPGRDRGAFTAELAAGLPALMLLLFAGITAVSSMVAKAQCLDAAREAALAEARGDTSSVAARIAPDGADIRVGGDRESVTVTVSVQVSVLGSHLPGIAVTATAVAAREPGAG
ncbi:TadE family type IV pilus minor pilin [Actinoplanes sp. NPDC020271]|uniref:TadE family type IV pilus minor pilin n=1 Tax=Actinoplanes sp. NPDC020271 TaxID=3363896 RepID=UPI0037BDB512